MIVESILYDKLGNGKVKCNICNHKCIINENNYGFCLTRKNINKKLYSCNFASISSHGIDPIEKKPLYHFLPGSLTYSLGGFGCNMRCLNCQNYIISQNFDKNEKLIEILPDMTVKNAINNNCQSITWTYNEPIMYLEYTLETILISHENNLKNIYVSNGYMSKEALDLLIPKIDAFSIDLKSMSNKFYKEICQANIDPILDNLKSIYKNKKHLEITNLIINDFNDSEEIIKKLIEFISTELGKDVPLHFSRFFPYYKMDNISPTNIEKLKKTKKMAIEKGINHVYVGNTLTDQNTYCPDCKKVIILRNGHDVINNKQILNGRCKNCGAKLNFVE